MIKTKLPGLNGLRAIAASFVLFSHVFQIAGIAGDAASKDFYDKHDLIGRDMVNLFFVISGFIITYILLKEKNEKGTISLKNFYIKRFLRIWPVYFGIIIVVLLLNRFTNVYSDYIDINSMGLVILILFLLTLGPIFPSPSISVLPHYWSLSVEEQFYIFWPPIFKKLKGKEIVIFSLIVIAGMILLRNSFAYLRAHYINEYIAYIAIILNDSMFGSIAIGIIGAWMIINKHSFLRFLFKPYVEIICWIVFLLLIIFPFYIPYIHYEAMASVYLVLILNTTSNPKAFSKLENKFFDFTGTISYGIYMFHWPLIPILIWGAKKAGIWNFMMDTCQIPLLIISYALTYLLAVLSYKYFESFFLKLKPANKSVTFHNNNGEGN